MRVPDAEKTGIDLADILAVARGERRADVLLRNARVVDLIGGEILDADIATVGKAIATVGKGLEGRRIVDLRGQYVAPGLVDAHVHVESAMLRPREFARVLAPHGVTTIIGNPHEIANVCGTTGIRFMREDARNSPVAMLMTVPSCVPATSLAGTGGVIDDEDLGLLLRLPDVVGLGEVMDFYGVVRASPRLLHEIERAEGMPIDGHAPGLMGAALDAYVAAGVSSDHECCSVDEASARLRRGMRVFLREGSAAHNLRALLPVISPLSERFLAFCTDDRDAVDLVRQGSIDHLVRLALDEGVPLVTALRMACLNPSEHYRLFDRGLIAPGRRADLVVFPSLNEFVPQQVWQAGRLVAIEGDAIDDGCGEADVPASMADLFGTVRVDLDKVDLRIPLREGKIRVIGVLQGQLLTEQRILSPSLRGGEAVADSGRDLLKLAVIERHRSTGRFGMGFVQGLKLARGAVASTVAHDHHNLIVAGADDLSMMTAARAVVDSGGGQAVAVRDQVLAHLALPLGGLMSMDPAGKLVRTQERVGEALKRLDCRLPEIFMTLSFLALEVIPELKLTDMGLVDVAKQQIVPLFTGL